MANVLRVLYIYMRLFFIVLYFSVRGLLNQREFEPRL